MSHWCNMRKSKKKPTYIYFVKAFPLSNAWILRLSKPVVWKFCRPGWHDCEWHIKNEECPAAKMFKIRLKILQVRGDLTWLKCSLLFWPQNYLHETFGTKKPPLTDHTRNETSEQTTLVPYTCTGVCKCVWRHYKVHLISHSVIFHFKKVFARWEMWYDGISVERNCIFCTVFFFSYGTS